MLFSLLLHIVVFFVLDRMKIDFEFQKQQELRTQPVAIRTVETTPADIERALPAENVVQPPADASKLLDEIDMADILPKDQEIDIKPEIQKAEYSVRLENPAQKGEPEAKAVDVSTGMNVDSLLPKLGTEPETIRPAAIGQLTVDPGTVTPDDAEIGRYTEDLIRQGAKGKVEKGSLDGITSLDKMIDLPPNILIGKKTMLPSDLLFEFNSADLRESAKVGLMKLGLLLDKNPDLYCWIEGHTDLVGGDEFNLNLSVKRADTVRNYLVKSLRMDGSRIITRGFGRYKPIVVGGTRAQQSANRRVEIKMRKTPPTDEQMKVEAKAVPVIQDPPTPKAILVKPAHVLPIEEPPPPRAAPVEEPAPRAAPVEEIPPLPDVPRATPVEIPRAEAVEP
jgi:OOP family OmpA-OmpF porin